jgi:hypothetical protein
VVGEDSVGGLMQLIAEAIEEPTDPACAPPRNENVFVAPVLESAHRVVYVGVVVEEVS